MSIKTDYDFSGWATRNDITCADGLTIRQDAFKDCDGKEVPLVYMHDHKEVDNVLGHALLENREDGVYCYGKFNEDTDQGLKAKALVAHGDLTSLSIYANQLVKRGSDVLHGAIREVSLVLAGANPGATIDFPVLSHSDGSYEDVEDEAIISYRQPLAMSDEMMHFFDEDDEDLYHADDEEGGNSDDPTVGEVMETLNEDQQKLLEGMMTLSYDQGYQDAKEEAGAASSDEEVAQSDINDGGNTIMHKNVFEKEDNTVLQHGMDAATASAILTDAKESGSSLKATTLSHGIEDIDWLFPEALLTTAAFIYLINNARNHMRRLAGYGVFLLLLFLPWTIHPWKRRLLPRQSLQEPRPVRRLYPARTLLWLRQPSGTEPVSKIYSSFRSLFVMRQGRSPASAACIYLLKDFFEALPAHPLSDVSRHRPPGQDPVSGFPWTAASDTGPPCRPPGTSF